MSLTAVPCSSLSSMPWATVVFWVPHKASAELMFDGGVPLLPVVIKCGQRQCSELCPPLGYTACTAQNQKSCCWKRLWVRQWGGLCRGGAVVGVCEMCASAVFQLPCQSRVCAVRSCYQAAQGTCFCSLQ